MEGQVLGQIQIEPTSPPAAGDATPSSLIRLWFVAEGLWSVRNDDFDEDSKLEPFRDKLSAQQNGVAHQLIQTRSTCLQHVLDKLSMWQAACGPGIGATLESSGDTYTFMVLSAMDDLREIIEAQLST